MAFYSLREWIEKLESEGELNRIKAEVDWNLEIGGIRDSHRPPPLCSVGAKKDPLFKKHHRKQVCDGPRLRGLNQTLPRRRRVAEMAHVDHPLSSKGVSKSQWL